MHLGEVSIPPPKAAAPHAAPGSIDIHACGGANDRKALLAQRAVARPLELTRYADIAVISVGELTEGSLLRRQGMITKGELDELRAAGAVGDTNGNSFNKDGQPVDHSLNRRTIGAGWPDLARTRTIAPSAGLSKISATKAILRGGGREGPDHRRQLRDRPARSGRADIERRAQSRLQHRTIDWQRVAIQTIEQGCLSRGAIVG